MINFCSCIKSSSSPLDNRKHRESSKLCKICSGKRSVDGRGAHKGSMLSNGGLELSRVIDPHLSWKIPSNRRQRAVRRARTSFTRAKVQHSPAKSLKPNKDHTDKDLKSTEDMPVSESEKVGVSILGRRFSDTLGSVPIKKRRFLFANSPSPVQHSSSYSDDSGHVLERKTSAYQGAFLKPHSLDTDSSSVSILGQGRNFGLEKTDLIGVNEKVCDVADFSGISILAAAACDSDIRSEFMNLECSVLKLNSSEVQGAAKENAEFDMSPCEKEEAVPHTSEDLVGRTDLPFEVSSSSVLPSKESNKIKSDGSCNLEASVNSFQNVPNNTTESFARDVRFHWDLNSVADAWEGHEEVLNSGQETTNDVSEDANDRKKPMNVESFMDQVGFGDTKDVLTDDPKIHDTRDHLDDGQQGVIFASEMKNEEKTGILGGNSTSDSKGSKSFFSNHDNAHVNEWCLKDAKSAEAGIHAETKSLIKSSIVRDNICSFGDSCPPIGCAVASVAAVADSFLSSDGVLEEGKSEAGKDEAHHPDLNSKVGLENLLPCLVSSDDKIIDQAPIISVLNSGGHSESGTDVTCTRSVQVEKHEWTSVKSETLKGDGSLVCRHAEGPEVRSDGNAVTDAADKTCCDNADMSREFTVTKNGSTGMKMNNIDAHNGDAYATEDDVCADIDFSACKSFTVTPGNTDAPSVLGPQGACRNDANSPLSNSQVVLENHIEPRGYPDASQKCADQEPGMEKVDFLGDDDSQYEDGELRESLANCWLDDGDEVETERVDYGSDRETDYCDATSDISFINQQSNNMGVPDASHDIQYREAGKDSQNISVSLLNSSSLANISEVDSEKKGGSTMGTGLQRNKVNDVGRKGFSSEADCTKRSSHSTSLRKMSGWDRLPGGCRDSGNREFRPGFLTGNYRDSSSDPCWIGDSTNRAIRSSLRRDRSSQVERVSPDMSRRNDRPYGRSSRSSDNNGFNSQSERNRDDLRSIGQSGPSMQLQGRGSGDRWVDSCNKHRGNSRHDSSSYYDSASFSHHGSRNAAAAAVAKVVSNGFVVAPDGTIVKANGAGSASHLSRRPTKGSSQNTQPSPMGRGSPIEREKSFGRASGPGRSREMSPVRPMFGGRAKPVRYCPETDGASHGERCRGSMPNGVIDSSSMHHIISRRDESFSPHRRPLHMSRSHSRSPSRSRTRSPRRWASPRGRSGNGIDGNSGLRQRSRSPNFIPGARMGRRRPDFGEHIASYDSISRNCMSPPDASRWINERKESTERFRDYNYRRRQGRSPPGRVFSRGHRFDLMDSPGRLKPDEYCRPMNSKRFPEFVDFGRGSRHGSKDDANGEHCGRYEVFCSARQCANDDNMKRLRYDDVNGSMAQNTRPKPSEFQRRDSPRPVNRGTERQDSPGGPKDEKCQLKNGRDGNYNASFNSIGAADGDGNMDAQRRPL